MTLSDQASRSSRLQSSSLRSSRTARRPRATRAASATEPLWASSPHARGRRRRAGTSSASMSPARSWAWSPAIWVSPRPRLSRKLSLRRVCRRRTSTCGRYVSTTLSYEREAHRAPHPSRSMKRSRRNSRIVSSSSRYPLRILIPSKYSSRAGRHLNRWLNVLQRWFHCAHAPFRHE